MRSFVCAVLVVVTATTFAFADNKQAAVHSRQGKAYFDTKQYDQAIVEFKKAYDLDPKSVTLFKIASAYYAKADYQGAIDYYAKYLASDPDGPLAQQALEFTAIANKALADARAKAEAEAKAKAEAEEKKRLDEQAEARRVAAAARIKQAEAFARAAAWSSAGDEYRAAATAGENPELLIEAAVAYAKQPDLEKARAAYLEYLEKVPLGAKSDDIRARVAELTKAIDKAVAERAAEEARVRRQQQPIAVPAEERSDFELAASLAPGVKLRSDNPFVLALRAEAALRLGRRVNLGAYIEYARLSTSGSCGTEIPGPDPATPFDIGPRGQLTKCSYLLPGLQLYVHVMPKQKIDPYLGVAPGFRFGSVEYTEYFGAMREAKSRTFLGIVLGVRGGVTYHLQPGPQAWTVGGFVEASYQIIGDEEVPESFSRDADSSYFSMFIGGRTTVTF